MPTYEYVCAAGHNFEQLQKMSDAPLTKCPVCGAKAQRKISGGSGLIFKGSGFYITDYGKDGKGPRKDTPEPSSSSSSSDSSTSSSSSTTPPPAPSTPAPAPAPKKAKE